MTHDAIARMKQDFIADATETVDKLSQTLASLGSAQQPPRTQVDRLFRAAHSLKGTSAMFELHEVSRVAESLENVLELARSGDMDFHAGMVDLLLEALDEVSLLLRKAKGEEVEDHAATVISKIEHLLASVSPASTEASRVPHQHLADLLPARMVQALGPSEHEVLLRWIKKGNQVFTIGFRLSRDAYSDEEEIIIRGLQAAGEIISILPGFEPDPSGGRTLTMIYVLTGDAEVLRAVVERCSGQIQEIALGRCGPEVIQPGSRPRLKPGIGPREKPKDGAADVPSVPLAVKVDIKMLDSMMNTLSELYSVRLGLLGIAKKLPSSNETRRLRDDLLKLGLLLNKRVAELEEAVVDARLVPISTLFDRYRGEVRRLARRSGKNVRLIFEGEATRVDRAMLDRLYDPLLHIIRNAVDHGIESGPERKARGKPQEGTVTLRARQEASHLYIEIEDDGRGIDMEKVRRAAAKRGFDIGSDVPPFSVLFEPGMSTKVSVSEISGRGVGLDAVKTQIDAIRGMTGIDTTVEHGTRFSIWVPLTLAVSRGVLLDEGDIPVVVPLGSVIEVIALTRGLAREIQETGILHHHGLQVAVVNLSKMLEIEHPLDARSIVILGVGNQRRAILAQKVCGETEIVSRPLPEAAMAPSFIAGATELHDGRPAIIIQPEELLRAMTAGAHTPIRERAPVLPHSRTLPERYVQSKSLSLLLFVAEDGLCALPLCLLREVMPLRSLTGLPVLRNPWQGLFFARGLCHGLLRTSTNGARPSSDVRNAAILGFPERCGIGFTETVGHCEIPFAELDPADEDCATGLISTFAAFDWKGENARVLDVDHILRENLGRRTPC